MPSIRASFTARRGRNTRRGTSPLPLAALAAALALTVTACGSGDTEAGGEATASAAAGGEITPEADSIKAIGYPAAEPFDGQKLYQCHRPGRLSINASDPTMYRIGCTMTGGSSGGGWVATGSDGKPELVSNTSTGPVDSGWPTGPRLGKEAKRIFDGVSEKYAGQ